MKRTDLIIAILLVIVFAQLVLSVVLLKKVNRLQHKYQKVSVSEYVSNMGERAEQNHTIALKYISRAKWLSERLDKCMEKLESQLELEPMPFELWPTDNFPTFEPNTAMTYTRPAEPFYVPFEEPNTTTDKNLSENQVRRLICMANLKYIGLQAAKYVLEPQIANLDERLRRLDRRLSEIADSNSAPSQPPRRQSGINLPPSSLPIKPPNQ